MVIMSHLSDLQTGHVENPSHRINFIKFLLMKYDKVKNENVLDRYFEIDADADYAEFCMKFPEHAEPNTESKREFEKAIKEGRLSDHPDSERYAGNYMYMGIHGGVAMFKHRGTREYLKVPEPSN